MENILNFCNISGSSVKKYEGKRKYIATGDIINNKIVSFEEVSFENKPSRANQDVEIGDVLFAKMQDTLKVLIIDENNVNNIYSTGFFVMKPKENTKSKFIYWLFNSDKFNEQKNKNCKGATQKAINSEGISKITIKELPTIKEQNTIVKYLDNVQEIIDIRKKQIEELDELMKSKFIEMFGNVIINEKKFAYKTIAEIADIVTGTTPDTNDLNNWSGDIKWITPAEINKNTFYIFDTERKITDKGKNSKSLQIMPKGTVLFTSRAPIGKTAIAGSEMCCNQGFKNCICKDNISNIYLYSVLKYNEEYLNSLGTGATFKELSKSNFSKIQISVPPLELQNQFTDIVKQIEEQKEKIQKSLEEMKKMQESLMNKYFG